jgi:hypothetical protein
MLLCCGGGGGGDGTARERTGGGGVFDRVQVGRGALDPPGVTVLSLSMWTGSTSGPLDRPRSLSVCRSLRAELQTDFGGSESPVLYCAVLKLSKPLVIVTVCRLSEAFDTRASRNWQNQLCLGIAAGQESSPGSLR